jgi:hypothetical protein
VDRRPGQGRATPGIARPGLAVTRPPAFFCLVIRGDGGKEKPGPVAETRRLSRSPPSHQRNTPILRFPCGAHS